MRSYASPVSIRTLFAMLIAFAVLFAPTATRAAEAADAAPVRHMQMMDSGPCQMPPAKSSDHGKMDKNCCISMCMAVAIAPTAPAEVAETTHGVTYFAVPKSWHGYLGEIATPPPRSA